MKIYIISSEPFIWNLFWSGT